LSIAVILVGLWETIRQMDKVLIAGIEVEEALLLGHQLDLNP